MLSLCCAFSLFVLLIIYAVPSPPHKRQTALVSPLFHALSFQYNSWVLRELSPCRVTRLACIYLHYLSNDRIFFRVVALNFLFTLNYATATTFKMWGV